MNSVIIFGAKYLIVVLVVVALAYFAKLSQEKRKQLMVFAIISLPIVYISAKISSLFFYDPRPFVIGGFVPLISHVVDNGFPSDHTLLSAAVSSVVFYFDKKVGSILFGLTFLVGASRVLAGVHHLVDLLGSIAISVVASAVIYKFVLPRVLTSKAYKLINNSRSDH